MIFIIAIITIFFLLLIYLYFRTEKLQLLLKKAQLTNRKSKKENEALLATLVHVANTQSASTKARLQYLKDKYYEDEIINQELQLITPFIHNYAIIFSACLKNKRHLSVITQKCYENLEKESYKKFIIFINKQDKKIKRMWNSNTLLGYISLIEALLQKFEQLPKNKKLAEAS